MTPIEKFVTGIIAVGLVTAIGLRAGGLAQFVGSIGTAGKQIEGTAING